MKLYANKYTYVHPTYIRHVTVKITIIQHEISEKSQINNRWLIGYLSALSSVDNAQIITHIILIVVNSLQYEHILETTVLENS